MKAEYSPRIDLKNRTKLQEVIPLSTPLTLFVDPSDACNFKCKFCPTSDRDLMKEVGRPWRTMDFEVFKKICNDMLQFPKKIEVLRLYKDGEPLLNKHFSTMVKFAKENKVANRIDTTTNASLLSEERSNQLANIGLDRVNVSVYGVKNEHYRSFSSTKIEFERVLNNIKYFYSVKENCELLVKINGDNLSEDEKKLFLDLFGNHADKIYIEHTMSCWPNFELGELVNNNFGIYGQEIKEVDICPYPFYSMSVNSDGKVSVCFLDWSRKMIIGDANENSLKAIWDGKIMKSYRKMFLDGKRKGHKICGDCGQMSHGLPDNLDPYRENIIKKLESINYFN